ncbi:hypothetical protein AB0A63_02955 [Lentzea sp. NPDC042327]|uniref:hypothetical protein n=1 Tax=Lentzea sp. NPDC042327 TaxID=3154801 RepID=UPI003407F1D7
MLVRLRPVVRATRTPDGLHLRGWASSCTITGGAGLWRVWQRLAPQLTAGLTADALVVPEETTPAVRAAVEVILEALREHDMLVTVPAEWDGPAPDVAEWLESVAADPVDAWRRLRAVTVEITGCGEPASAAARAVEAVGLAVRVSPRVEQPTSLLLLTADPFTLQAGCGADVGYVLPPSSLSSNTEATAQTDRLNATGTSPAVLAALIGSTAVHRLLCAVAGLEDPAAAEARTPHPQVLIARTTPLRATYHPLLTGPPPTDPWRALDALTDAELGLVEPPVFGELPQVPAKLATCGTALGIGTTADAARLDAALAAVKTDAVLGVDDLHARGAALRLAARHHPGEPVEPPDDPTARRWWKALTERFAVPAELRTTRLAPGVHRAEVHRGHHLLAWAVEATAADAVAFAALAATGHAQAGRTGTAHLTGAAPHRADAGQPSWVTREWLWPNDVRDREQEFQDALTALPGVRVTPRPLDPEPHAAGLVAYAVDPR